VLLGPKFLRNSRRHEKGSVAVPLVGYGGEDEPSAYAKSRTICLDVLMNREADFIKEIRYLIRLMRQNCQDASWRVERLLSKLEEGESLDTIGTSVDLSEARNELHLLMRGIEGIEKLCELESDDDR
jgi:hypothetical protein